ncbi:hypothetical protein F511_29425 [Dorcoceras hygrometricum]|uniref:Uncharacterized protein n=1 Tax=Dorcoceras hygrometricum TaxID=472368 RepID=A0A2Z7BJY6_9LAMI|nr:hypothetical protein F511_29425 [Dorcoceras hygrometricum]
MVAMTLSEDDEGRYESAGHASCHFSKTVMMDGNTGELSNSDDELLPEQEIVAYQGDFYRS